MEHGNAPEHGSANARQCALADEPQSFVNAPSPLARLPRLLHDLGNPLTAIATNVEFLHDIVGDFSGMPANQVALMREVLQEIGQSADRMREITRALQELASTTPDSGAQSEVRTVAKAQPRDGRDATRAAIALEKK